MNSDAAEVVKDLRTTARKDLDRNKREAAQEFLGFEVSHYRDSNFGTPGRRPEDKGKLILVTRIRENGTVFRCLVAKDLPFQAAIKLVSWPLEVQRLLCEWSPTRRRYWLISSLTLVQLEKLAAGTVAEAQKKLMK